MAPGRAVTERFGKEKEMTKKETAHFKEILLARQAELSALLRIRDDIRIEQAPDALDAVQNATMRELAIRNLDRDYAQLRLIRAALHRLQDGTFGICQNCDEEISPKRLKAVPWAAYCISCQELADRMKENGEDGGDDDLAIAA
jgi:DnaK suppressor protein